MRHKFSLSEGQVQILDELMEADKTDNGVCFQDRYGNYKTKIKEDIDFLKSIGFITEYVSETHIVDNQTISLKGWTITYHGIAFLFAYHTLKN